MSSKQCIVVGGSLGGLMAGISLKRLGYAVTILERNPTPLLHDQGAGIVAGGDVQAFFDTLRLVNRPLAVTSRLRQYLDKSGSVIDREVSTQQMTSWDMLYNVLRTNFDRTPTDYCAIPDPIPGQISGQYLYGQTVSDVKVLSDGEVEVFLTDSEGQKGSKTTNFLLAADGPSSTIRRLLLPNVKRTYAGYLAWRGTVPESELSASATATFPEKFTFYHTTGLQILAYAIPGPKGTIERGARLVNFVWYCNYAEGSAELASIMTDTDGHVHPVTLPPGKMKPQTWEAAKEMATRSLPPQFAELVHKTRTPFVQCITDVLSPQAVFHSGKVLLVGDAVAGFRPHTAASTNQAAFHAMLLEEFMGGEGKNDVKEEGNGAMEEWEREVLRYATHMQAVGVSLGNRSQFGRHPLAA